MYLVQGGVDAVHSSSELVVDLVQYLGLYYEYSLEGGGKGARGIRDGICW